LRHVSLLLAGMWICFCMPLTGHAAPVQFTRKEWTTVDGSPGSIYAIAQTTDGTLWIGGTAGLVRFDGVKFVRYPEAGDDPLRSNLISVLAASPDGSLWIGFRFGGVAMLRNGHVIAYGKNNGLPEGTVSALAWGRDGSLYAATTRGLARLHGARWERLGPETDVTTYGAYVDRKGTLWVATNDRVLARAANEQRFREIAQRSGPPIGGLPFAESPDGAVWTWTVSGLTRMLMLPDGTTQTDIRQVNATPPLAFDREGALWLGGDTSAKSVPDQLMSPTAGKGVQIYFPDREGNMWAGMESGLERFTRNSVANVPLRPCEDWGYGLAKRPSRALWIACADPRVTRGVTEVSDGMLIHPLGAPTFTASYSDADGSTWLGSTTTLSHIDPDGRMSVLERPDGTAGLEIQAIAGDARGGLWISVVRKGMFRLDDHRWSAYGGFDALPREPAIVATSDPSGAVWFGYTNQRIARLQDGSVQLFGPAEGLAVGNVTAIATLDQHIWISGELGLQLFDGTRFISIRSVAGNPFTGITGILRSEAGDLWLNGDHGISHIPRAQVDRVLRDPTYPVHSETFNALDGVVGSAQPMRPIPSAVETTDGHMWFATTAGVILIDPTRIVRNHLPPPVTIWSITSNGVRYPVHGGELSLPVHTTKLQIDYTAGSLTVPERVQFRYKLEGFDHSWQDGADRRAAFYTSLSPGQYVFRVIASNNDAVWNTRGSSARFTILPAFYQTWWFNALCLLGFLILLTWLYHMRIRQIRVQVLSRLEERLAERERIARELHDTLLQGVQGLILRFQSATDIIPAREPARCVMEQTLERADDLLTESRARVKDLREPASSLIALPEALAAEGEQLALTHSGRLRVTTEGAARPLHLIVREEVFLIAREALTNAFQHAHATRMEAEVCYDDTELRLSIRDDGCGFDPVAFNSASRNSHCHFGLLGMRERARKLSGDLEIWSAVGAGTELKLRVPAAVAYSESRRPLRRSWWSGGRHSMEGIK
jgi:signal transduction histidine kinase/ligand-binding sensor domain-containing protein